MFPHTVTLYNIETRTDPMTCKDETVSHITLLEGVLVEEARSVGQRQGLSVRANGPVGKDAVTVYIPFGVSARDGVTGGGKAYLPPEEFWRAEDKSRFWTLAAGRRREDGQSGGSLLLRGEAVYPGLDAAGLEAFREGAAYWISSVAVMDFGGLPHWEIGGN